MVSVDSVYCAMPYLSTLYVRDDEALGERYKVIHATYINSIGRPSQSAYMFMFARERELWDSMGLNELLWVTMNEGISVNLLFILTHRVVS